MLRASVLSGQVYGKVDWITADGRELGMFLRTSEREPTRCVVRGPEVEALIANRIVQKGMMVTAFGEFSARVETRHDTGAPMPELLCTAAKVVAEPPREQRLRGSVHVNLKGVVMYWDTTRNQIKTFLNAGEMGRTEQVTCNVYLGSWMGGLSDESRQRLSAAIVKGREYTLAALTEVSFYREKNSNNLIPSLMLLPLDFKLQG